MKLIYTGDFERLKDIRRKIKLSKLIDYSDYLEGIKEDLEYINSLVDESIEMGWSIFNISTKMNVNLAYKLFKKGEQYSFGDERYHWHHINISVSGMIRLNRYLSKVNKKIAKIDKKILKIQAGLVKKEEK